MMKCFYFTKENEGGGTTLSLRESKVSWVRSLSVASSSAVDNTRKSRDFIEFYEYLTQRRGNDVRVFSFYELKMGTKGGEDGDERVVVAVLVVDDDMVVVKQWVVVDRRRWRGEVGCGDVDGRGWRRRWWLVASPVITPMWKGRSLCWWSGFSASLFPRVDFQLLSFLKVEWLFDT
ncbi:hypothetical protein K7X08_021514 [Anisodus acutangulus]|uniref:Uncharacterized protein n=1 Tax=Anisodus acutangulus TaxID=402998 RepID=A0A9Q1RDF4_9SOLA|nr:hypothetical protein K7X08_021514 [Anisodus acutangulus]